MMPMYSLGTDFQPPAIHSGGLRYHGASPIVSALLAEKLIQAQAVETDTVFHYARVFAQAESLIPAPESSHAIAAACLKALELERDKNPGAIIFCLSGHGLIDMAAYDSQFGKVEAKAARGAPQKKAAVRNFSDGGLFLVERHQLTWETLLTIFHSPSSIFRRVNMSV